MKLINAELQAKELKLKQLSQELQDEIAQHKATTKRLGWN